MLMDIYRKTNQFLEECFYVLEAAAPAPEWEKNSAGHVLRYKKEDQCLELAIIQKLVRYISGLNASLILLEAGYIQELGAIFRTLDEFQEDITFLVLPITGGIERTPAHDKYLEHFFQEEFDNPGNAFLSTQKRELIPRKKIRAVIAHSNKAVLNPHDAQELSRTLSQAYSGYVHGASGHILEMVGGNPLSYFLSGMPGTLRQEQFTDNYWHYALGGLVSVVLAAKALGATEIIDNGNTFIEYFEKATGRTGSGDTEKLMKKVKRKNA